MSHWDTIKGLYYNSARTKKEVSIDKKTSGLLSLPMSWAALNEGKSNYIYDKGDNIIAASGDYLCGISVSDIYDSYYFSFVVETEEDSRVTLFEGCSYSYTGQYPNHVCLNQEALAGNYGIIGGFKVVNPLSSISYGDEIWDKYYGTIHPLPSYEASKNHIWKLRQNNNLVLRIHNNGASATKYIIHIFWVGIDDIN